MYWTEGIFAVVFADSGLSSLTLVRRLKDPIQQKVLVGVALLLVLIAPST
jgi:hypothetical protein